MKVEFREFTIYWNRLPDSLGQSVTNQPPPTHSYHFHMPVHSFIITTFAVHHHSRLKLTCFTNSFHQRLLVFYPLYWLYYWLSSARLVLALVLSRLDYCNAVLTGLQVATLAPLQWVVNKVNVSSRLLFDIKPRDHATSTLRKLHWLPIPQRIEYKLCLLVYKTFIGQSPDYISDLLTPVTYQHARRCAPPAAAATSFSQGRSYDSETVHFCCCTPWVESFTNRFETHAVIDNNIQASFKGINPVQLSMHFPLTMECAIGLIVGGALQMQPLLLLLLSDFSKFSHLESWTPVSCCTDQHLVCVPILLELGTLLINQADQARSATAYLVEFHFTVLLQSTWSEILIDRSRG